MSALESGLLDWGERLPLWQRDLLRRLAQGEVLEASDYRNYATEAERVEYVKPAPWSDSPQPSYSPDYKPLDSTHLQSTASGIPPVVLTKITHLEGVNDIAPGTVLPFAKDGLTIIAGGNGSGKSGYVRILKQAAVSRSPEKVLPNVFHPEQVPKAVISYQIGASVTQDFAWQSGTTQGVSPLQRVRVFDAKSATKQLSTSNEVAFIPPVLQILADFTSALKVIGDIVENDLQSAKLAIRQFPELKTGLGLEILNHLGETTGLESLNSLTQLSEDENAELLAIPTKIQLLTISDSAKLAVQARARAGQLSILASNLGTIRDSLSESRVNMSIDIYQRLLTAQRAVDDASKQIIQYAVLPETGSVRWRTMWLAAKDYVHDALDIEFPDLSDSAVCALCQQTLDLTARERLERFTEFMKDEVQTELCEAQLAREADIAAFKALQIEKLIDPHLVDLITTYDRNTGEGLLPLVADAANLCNWLISPNTEYPPEDPVKLTGRFEIVIKVLNKSAIDENIAADSFASSDTSAIEASRLQAREQELKIRQHLWESVASIREQHDLMIKIGFLQAAAKVCDTAAASRENTKLSKEYVDRVCAAFDSEIKKLHLDRVPVKLVFEKTTRGVSYIRIILAGAQEAAVQDVLSEGEQRVAAIAGFFADLMESGDHSTLVFDDPVCSLDQSYREAVAHRLLLEAVERQVLVFSHDCTFVQYLYEQQKLLEMSAAALHSATSVAKIEYVHIARSQYGTGELTTAESWRHVSIKEQMKRLNDRIQNVRSLYKLRDDMAYEREARDIMGSMREIWECFVEQELLNGVVQRHERAIHTQCLKCVVDIDSSDVAAVNEGMTICSRWLTGHKAPTSDCTKIISPDQIQDEMTKFADYRTRVLKRRR